MNRFRECRENMRFSQKYVAVTIGVKPPQISKWESGTGGPSRENLKKLANLYGVSVDYLLGISDTPDPAKDETIPLTDEVRILAEGIDKLPQRQKEMAMNVVKTILSQYSDYFEKGTDENDP